VDLVSSHQNETSNEKEKPLMKRFLFYRMRKKMNINIHNHVILSEAEMLRNLADSAKLYSEYVDKDLLFIFRKNKNSDYEYVFIRCNHWNFMHLAGIRSKTLSAADFYDACLHQNIAKSDCTPSNNATSMYAKIAVMPNLMDLKKSKFYKIGEKDLITRDNDFVVAIGNGMGIIGYEEFDDNINLNPKTLLTNPITYYSTNPQKISFVLQKNGEERAYKKVIYEPKKGLCKQELVHFSKEIQEMITIES